MYDPLSLRDRSLADMCIPDSIKKEEPVLARLAAINQPLLAWYRANARKLPWRDEPEGYHVWVSEIMLQQTRVEAVRPYYSRFIRTLPTIADLAACEEDTLMKLWEGLGYYSRVRNMQRCARVLMKEYGGKLPEEYERLIKLPGIGPYTAGAIASIAFGKPVPAVDGNVLRVISRITASEEDILLPSVRSRIDRLLRITIPKENPSDAGVFNQALMDLGASVCLPSSAAMTAKCGLCPLADLCLARQKGMADRLPVRIVKAKRRKQEKTILVISDGRHAVIGKRPSRGLLAGMYGLPDLDGRQTEEAVLAFVKELGVSPLRIKPLPEARHVFTHIDWMMSGWYIFTEDLTEAAGPAAPYLAVDIRSIGAAYAIPSAFRSYMKYL